jgi:GntR family transcriptional regulator, rspAB operon transcriptional repressor
VIKPKLIILETETIRQKVHHHIREQILNGEIGQNERLIETQIAKDIGTSRTPVREALHNLEQEGLIEAIPRIGYRVKTISDQEAAEIWEIRIALDTLSAKWAYANAPSKLAEELAENITLAELRASKGKPEDFVEHDGQFHKIIARYSGGVRLLELTQTLRRHALRYRIQSIHHSTTIHRAIEEHKIILQAIRQGDMDAIDKAVRSHLEQSKTDTIRYAFKDSNLDKSEH